MKLTRAEIFSASPEQLDQWVAMYVMGWRLTDRGFYVKGEGQPESYDTPKTFRPTSDIATAWKVVEKIVDTTIEEANCAPSTRFMVLWRHANLCASSASEAAWRICYMALMAKVGEP